MQSLNPEHLDAVMKVINESPFFRHMSMRVTEMGMGYSVVTACIGREHMNPFGGLHGGVYAAVLDTAAYWSAYCHLPADKGLVSLDLKVDFLAAVRDGKIVIKGKSIKTGKTICLAEATMLDEDGRLLGHGTSKVLVTANQQSMDDAVNYLGSGKLPPKFIEI